MIYCPNINSKEFQDLVSSVGEDRAYFLFNKYEGNVPDSYYTIPTNDNIIPVTGNEKLYEKYNLLNKEGKSKKLNFAEAIKWARSLNQSNNYKFLVRNTPDGYRIFIAEKSTSLFGQSQSDGKFLIEDSVSDNKNYTNQITFSEALQKAKEMLPSINQDDLQFLTAQALFREAGRDGILGMYKGTVFVLDKDGKGTTQEYILRHELFHKIFTEYLTKDEQVNVEKYLGSEEQLALIFQHWKNNKTDVPGTLRKIFNKILRFLGILKANYNSIDAFFEQIEKGNFSIQKQSLNSSPKFLTEVKKKFKGRNFTVDENGLSTDELENFKILKDRFLEDFNSLSEKGIKINNNYYIITGHNEIKQLILSKLALQQKDLNIRRTELLEALKSDPDNKDLLNEKIKVESDLMFARLYSFEYSYIYEQMFPNSLNKSKKIENIENLRYLFSDEETENDDNLEYSKGNAFSFQEEVYDSYSKTSTKVKSILSNVYDHQRKKYVSWGEAYKISLELLNDLPAQDLDKWVSLLSKRVSLYNKSSYLAVLNKLIFMKNKATLSTYKDKKNIEQAIPKNAKFINLDGSSKPETFIIAKDKNFDISKIERVEDIKIFLKEGEYVIVTKDSTRTTRDFIQKILLTFEELDDPNFSEFENNVILLNNLRVKQFYNQALTELLQNLTSQKENNRFIGSKETNEKGTEYKYYDAVRESIERSIRTDIEDKISSKLYLSKLVEEFINENKDTFFNNGKPLIKREEQLKAIKSLLDNLGFSSYNYNNIDDYTNTNKLYKSLQHFIFGNPLDKNSKGKISKVGKERIEDNFVIQDTIGYILENEGSLKDEIGKFLRFNLEVDRPGMSKKASGKMVYNYTPSSNGMDIFRRLAKKNYLNTKNELPYENGFEFLQTEYFKLNPFNPFSEKPKIIHQVGIHDGVVSTSSFGRSGKQVTEYTKEDLSGFIDRTFNFGFLTSLTKDSNLRYIQFTSPVSNRPNIPGIQLDLLSNIEFDNMVDLLLQQIVARPDYKNVQNYDKHKLINLDKLGRALSIINTDIIKDGKIYLTENHLKNTDFLAKVKQQLKKEIAKDAEILFKQVVENQLTFSSSFDKNGLVRLYEILRNSNKNFLDPSLDINSIIKQLETKLGNGKYFETWTEVKKRFAAANEITYTDVKDLNQKVPNDMLKQYGWERQYKINNSLKEAILPLFQLYLQNDYVNSYFLDQINMGGTEFFKNSVDRVKRRQGAYSPGLKGLVNSEIGMSKTFKTAVVEDPTRIRKIKESSEDYYEEDYNGNYLYDLLVSSGVIDPSSTEIEKNKIYKRFVNKFDKFNPSDAQGYMLPERASELQKGFGESYQIGNVLKPAHYEIDKNGIPRMVKYSAIVLTDDLIKDFPQLGHLRNKMRKANTGELVFHSAFKVGAPEARLGMTKNEKGKYEFSEQEFNKLFEDNDYQFSDDSIVELSNERYKLQLNPEHDLEHSDGGVAKPTQLFYFLKILNTNLEAATKVYTSLAKIMDLELKDFKNKYINEETNTFKSKEFIDYLILKGSSSTTEVYHEILAELSNKVQNNKKDLDLKPWNFPSIEDKIITQFSSTLQNNVVQTKFKGTKLVLMSQVKANMEGLERLKYKVDESGNLYAECYLPKKFLKKEIEDKIMSSESHIFFDPELLGFRIPSSELHSGVPIRVKGFHNLDSNVIIAPEELVPLHGSDFDVDSLYVITQELKDNEPIGYKKINNQYVLMDEEEFMSSISNISGKDKENLIKSYYKNSISNIIIKTISSRDNRDRMISPISMIKVQDTIESIFEKNPNLNPSGKIDESSAIDKQKVHSSSMNGRDGTGIFANFAKGLAYILHTSSNEENPLLLKKENNLPYFISDMPLNTLVDVTNLWEDLDSLLNAAIDNVKEQILPKLNLNGTTIPTFAMMLGLGISLEDAANIMVQPIVKHLASISGKDKETSKGVISANRIIGQKLQVYKNSTSLTTKQAEFIKAYFEKNLEDGDILLTKEEIEKAISKEVISNSNLTINDITDLDIIIIQAKVLENYKRTESIVNEFNKIVRYLSIVRDLPVFSNKVEELLDLRNQIWNDEGKTLSSFPFNVDNFFESNPHIAKSDEVLQFQKELLSKNFFKHNPRIQDFFSTIPSITFDVNKFNDIKNKQDEFVKFVYSSLYFTASNVKITPFIYKIKNFKSTRQLLDQEAFVQHFANKIRILKDIMPDNYFIKRFSSIELGYSADLKKLAFYLDNKITPLDKAEFEAAFKELSKYNIEAITKKEYDDLKNSNVKRKYGDNYYRIITRDLSLEQSLTSDLQKEFVQYNILTEGMRNSSSSYSQLLPGFIYRDQYYKYENLMKEITENFSLKLLSNIYNVYTTNLALTNADKIVDFNERYEFKNGENYFFNNENQKIYFDIVTNFSGNSQEFIKIKHPIYKSNFKSQEEFENNAESIESSPEDFLSEGSSKKKPDYYQTKIYKLVFSNKDKAYYQLISLVKNNKVYKSNAEIFTNSEEGAYNRFAPDYYHIKYSEINGNTITLANETNSNFLLDRLFGNIPNKISISEINDTLRLNTKFIKIESIDKPNRKITFSEIPIEDRPEVILVNETVRLKPSREIITTDKNNKEKAFFTRGTFTLEEVLSKIDNFTDPIHNYLINILKPYINSKNATVIFGHTFKDKKMQGLWTRESGTFKIELNKNLITNSQISNVFTHELLHHVVYSILHKDSDLLTTNQKEAKKRLEALYNAAIIEGKKDGKTSVNMYGLTNLDEFVSEAFSNPEFQKWLSSKKINKKSLWTRFKEAICDLFGITEGNMLYEVITNTLELISDNTQNQDENKSDSVSLSKRQIDPSSLTEKFIEVRKPAEDINLQVATDVNGNELDYYTSNIKNFERSTNDKKGFQTFFIKNYNYNRYEKGTINFEADRLFGDDESIEKYIPRFSRSMNKSEYIFESERVQKEAQLRGKMTESLFKYMITLDSSTREEVIAYMNQLPPEIYEKILVLQDYEVIRKIVFNKMQSNLLNGENSKIDFSIPVFSKSLNRAGTIDMMVRHEDGEYSLFDMKTSQFFSEGDFTKMFAYGLTSEFNIPYTERNKAKLQIMFYALMARLNNPNIKFKRLSILNLPVTSSKENFLRILDRNTLSQDNVESNSYLEMIKSFLQNKKHQVELGLIKENEESLYDQLEKEYKSNGGKSIDDLFNSEKYFNYYNPTANVNSNIEYGKGLITKKSLEERILQEISILSSTERDDLKILNPTKEEIEITRFGEKTKIKSLEKYRKERIKELIQQWITLTGDKKLSFLSMKDIDFLHLNIGSNKDIDNPIFQTWNKFKFARQNAARLATEEKVLLLKSKIDKILPNRSPINFNSQRELFGKFIKREYNQKLGRGVERLVHKNSNDPEYNKLSKDEKDFIDYLNDTFESYFSKDAYLNTTGSFYISAHGEVEGITHLEAYNKGKSPFEYYPGWFPKTPILPEEYREKVLNEKGTIDGTKQLLSNWADRQLTQYFENLFNINEDTAAIPIKYLGNAEIEDKQLYSVKLDKVFEMFIDALERKIHLDDVYHTGRSITMLLQQDNDLTGPTSDFDPEQKQWIQKYQNLTTFIKDRMDVELKDIPITKINYLSKELIVGDKKIDFDKSMLLLSQGATASVMWLKPISGLGNMIMGNMVKYREALKHSIGSRLISDLESKHIDYTYTEALWAEKEYMNLITDSISDSKMYSNKLFLIAEKFGYLADNYRFGSNARKFKSDRNPLFSSDNMYIFHTLGEKYLSYTTLAAQLKHYKVKVDGKEVSIYDLYKVAPIEGSNYHKLEWIGPERTIKDGNVLRKVNGISDDEMYRFKAVSARMQGDYRKEEHIRLEKYALGKITVVLKKFFSRLILNGIQGKHKSRALGWYNEIETTDENGNNISALQWEAREIEGKWRTLANAFSAIIRLNPHISQAGGFMEYWNKASHEEKLNLIDALITASFVILAYGAYVLMFSDTDDDDTWKKAWKTYLIDNASQQYNFIDLLRTGTTVATPVLVKKAYDFATSGTQLILLNGIDAIVNDGENIRTEKGDIRGLNMFLKSVPYTAFGQDFYNKINNINVEQYGWFSVNPDKLRN